jgi:glucan phosphoethanolaminetransferase (alkaline phosphatase superfamily)
MRLVQIPNSLKALSIAAMLCLPAAAFAFYMAYAFCVVWGEDVDKTFMSEVASYRAPTSDRALAHIRASSALFVYVAIGALLPVVVLCSAARLRFFPLESVRHPGPLLFIFLVLCSGGIAFIGIINQPYGFALLPLSALAAAASFVPFVPASKVTARA